MNIKEITEKILTILNEELKISNTKFTVNDMDKDLFGAEVRMFARDAMVLYCRLEQAFSIKITESAFEKFGFRTIRNFVDIVEYCKN